MAVIDLVRRYSASAWLHRWKAVAVVWLVALLGWTGVRMLPDRYVSTARVYADADAVLGVLLRGIALDSPPAAQVEVLQRTLVSRPNLEGLVDRTTLSRRGADREKTIQALARDLRFASQTRNLFTVEYLDSDPRVAHEVVQQVVDLFLGLAGGSDRRQLENARAFLQQQLTTYEQQLNEAERRRAEFVARYKDLLSLNGSTSRLDTVHARIEAIRGELVDAINRCDLLKKQIAAIPEAAPSTGAVASIAEAEQRLKILRRRYTEQHPEVTAARATLEVARSVANGSGASRANPVREQLLVRVVDTETQIASLERQLRDMETERKQLEEIARNAPGAQAQFTNLDRDYNLIRRNYEELLSRREAVNIAEAARNGTHRVTLEVIDPPTMPSSPTSPNRMLLAAGVLVAALGTGGALLFLQVRLDTSFYTLRELRGIGPPVLGAFSAPPHSRVCKSDVMLLVLCLLPLPFGFVVAVIGPLNLMAKFAA